MADDSEVPPIERTKSAKSRSSRGMGSIDRGALAIGLVLPVGLFSPTVIWELPAVLTLGLTLIGLFIGGFLTGYLSPVGTVSRAIHGATMAVIFWIIVVLIVGTTLLSEQVLMDLSIVAAFDGSWLQLAIYAIFSVGIATLSGTLATRSPS